MGAQLLGTSAWAAMYLDRDYIWQSNERRLAIDNIFLSFSILFPYSNGIFVLVDWRGCFFDCSVYADVDPQKTALLEMIGCNPAGVLRNGKVIFLVQRKRGDWKARLAWNSGEPGSANIRVIFALRRKRLNSDRPVPVVSFAAISRFLGRKSGVQLPVMTIFELFFRFFSIFCNGQPTENIFWLWYLIQTWKIMGEISYLSCFCWNFVVIYW